MQTATFCDFPLLWGSLTGMVAQLPMANAQHTFGLIHAAIPCLILYTCIVNDFKQQQTLQSKSLSALIYTVQKLQKYCPAQALNEPLK